MITMKKISKTYGEGDSVLKALRGVDLTVKPMESIAIMGPSGSGKSTLLNILGLLDEPDQGGEYLLLEQDILQLKDKQVSAMRNRTFGFIFQSFNLLPRYSALENVEIPMRYANVPRNHRRERALRALESVGLADRASHTPAELSGGQQQRVAIARALVNEPKIIFADEPTGNLDSASAESVMRTLQNLNSRGLTLVMITHARDIAQHAQRVLHLHDGQFTKEERN